MHSLKYLLSKFDKDTAIEKFQQYDTQYLSNISDIFMSVQEFEELFSTEYPNVKVTYLAAIGIREGEGNFLEDYLDSLTEEQFIDQFIPISKITILEHKDTIKHHNKVIAKSLAKRVINNHDLITYIKYFGDKNVRDLFILNVCWLDSMYAMTQLRDYINYIDIDYLLMYLDVTNISVLEYTLERRSNIYLLIIHILTYDGRKDANEPILIVTDKKYDDIRNRKTIEALKFMLTKSGLSCDEMTFDAMSTIAVLPIMYFQAVREICGEEFVNSAITKLHIDAFTNDI